MEFKSITKRIIVKMLFNDEIYGNKELEDSFKEVEDFRQAVAA